MFQKSHSKAKQKTFAKESKSAESTRKSSVLPQPMHSLDGDTKAPTLHTASTTPTISLTCTLPELSQASEITPPVSSSTPHLAPKSLLTPVSLTVPISLAPVESGLISKPITCMGYNLKGRSMMLARQKSKQMRVQELRQKRRKESSIAHENIQKYFKPTGTYFVTDMMSYDVTIY